MGDSGFQILRPFVEAARALWRKELSDEARWREIGKLLPMLLESEALQERARSWPAPQPGSRRAQNLLFYEDPDYHFVINRLVKRPHDDTPIHDHAHTWTVYGVLSGGERVVRFKRTDDGAAPVATLEPIDDYVVAPGYIDVAPPRDCCTPNTSATNAPSRSSCAANGSAASRRTWSMRRHAV
jgi:predicted metal-dependent enzyme (double-stranded beta helix superfamily)